MIETLAWYPSKSNSEVYHIIKCDVVCVGNEVLTFRQFWLLYWILMKTNVTLSDILVIILFFYRNHSVFSYKIQIFQLVILSFYNVSMHLLWQRNRLHVPCMFVQEDEISPKWYKPFHTFFFFKSFGGVGRI